MKRLFLLAGLICLGLALTQPALADSHQVVGETSVVVPAGGEATIDINAFCLEFGEPFPDAVTGIDGRADGPVLKLMRAALRQGIAQNDVLQTQIALWRTIEGDWGYEEDDVDLSVAESLLEASESEPTTALTGRGTALDEAVAAGSVEMALEGWAQAEAEKVFASDAPYYGSGTVRITSKSEEDVTVYYPYGMVLPAVDESQQTMGSYSVEMQEVEKPEQLPKTGAGDSLPLTAALLGLALVTIGLLPIGRRS